MSKGIILKPRLSEKAYGLSDQRNTFVFDIEPGINGLEVAAAVTKQYEVAVTDVRIAASASKNKRRYRRGGRVVHKSQTSPLRKAYVTLKEGDTLPFFAAVEESNKAPEDKGSKK